MATRGFVTSPWVDETTELLRGRRPDEPVGAVVDVEFVLADGSHVRATPALMALLEPLLAGLAGRRARVEVAPALLTAKQAAEMLGVSRPTVYTMQDNGVLSTHPVGNRRMVPLDDVTAVLAARAARARADQLAEAAAHSTEEPLGADELRQALSTARKDGPEAVAAVRRQQAAARVAHAARRARS